MAEERSSLAEEREFVSRYGPSAVKTMLSSRNGAPCRIARVTVWFIDQDLGLATVQEPGDPTQKDLVPWLPPYDPKLGDFAWYLKFGDDGFLLGPTTFDEIEAVTRRVPGIGPVGFGAQASDVTLSTTAGTYTTILSVLDVPTITGHTYRVKQGGGHSFVTGGSGFAFSDSWDFRVFVDEGSGYNSMQYGAFKRIRDNEDHSGAKRYPIPELTGYHLASITGLTDFKFEASKTNGVSTVTTSVQANGGLAAMTLLIEDLGIMNLGE